MKSNQKGFTLIELLAVIVILAIIALITTPIVLDLISNARLDAARNKMYGVIDAVRLAYTQNQVTDSPVQAVGDEITTDFGDSTNPFKLGNEATGTTISISGERPNDGSVTINVSTGKITATNVQFNGYYCNVEESATDDNGNDITGTAVCEQGTATQTP